MLVNFDAYVLRAQLAPAALAAAPAAILGLGALSSIEKAGSVMAFIFAAVLMVTCGVIRSLGRRLQPGLWKSWGGSPAIQLLRWSGSSPRPATHRRHALLAGVLGESLPSPEEEAADPRGADERYTIAVRALRQRTRTGPQYKLVAHQNAEYGFRRNCLGLRPFALGVAAAVLAASISLLFAQDEAWQFAVAAGASVLALPVWGFLVTPDWVRSAADLYAERLMEAIESLAPTPQTENKAHSRVVSYEPRR